MTGTRRLLSSQRPTVSLLAIDILSKDIDIVIRISGISDKRTDLVKRADAESENKEPNEIVSEKKNRKGKKICQKIPQPPYDRIRMQNNA